MPRKKKGKWWIWLVVALVIAGGVYYYQTSSPGFESTARVSCPGLEDLDAETRAEYQEKIAKVLAPHYEGDPSKDLPSGCIFYEL